MDRFFAKRYAFLAAWLARLNSFPCGLGLDGHIGYSWGIFRNPLFLFPLFFIMTNSAESDVSIGIKYCIIDGKTRNVNRNMICWRCKRNESILFQRLRFAFADNTLSCKWTCFQSFNGYFLFACFTDAKCSIFNQA